MKRAIFILIAVLLAASQGIRPALADFAEQTASCPETYIVKSGDYLGKIAWKCKISLDDLLAANPDLTRSSRIFVGESIAIPAPAASLTTGSSDINYSLIPYTTGRYVVKSGETISQIAETFETTVNELMNLNPEIIDPRIIYVGQVLRLPQDSSSARVLLSADHIKANYTVIVTVYNYPPNADIDYYLISVDTGVATAKLDGKTDAYGTASGYISMPSTAAVGSHWKIRVVTTELRDQVSETSPVIAIITTPS